jgi:hypothetical protein
VSQLRKYEKCLSEAKSHREGVGEATFGTSFGFFENKLCPHQTEVHINCNPMANASGNIIKLPNGQQGQFFPHKHAFTEIFYEIGTDPFKPDDLGGVHEMWIGEGEEAEGVWIDKPSAVVVPAGMTHLPHAVREVRRPFLSLTICDYPVTARVMVPKVPSGFKTERKPDDPIPKLQKYAKYYSENNITDAPVFAAHKGKSHVALLHDFKQNELASHYTKVDIIYGDGIGWGCGDTMQVPHSYLTGLIATRRSLPIKHPITASYYFIPTGNLANAEDLGGTIEFWIGEGEEAEQYIITKPTFVFIPPDTVHMPIYIKELHKPFFMATILDTPLWAGVYNEKFPTAFDRVAEG